MDRVQFGLSVAMIEIWSMSRGKQEMCKPLRLRQSDRMLFMCWVDTVISIETVFFAYL